MPDETKVDWEAEARRLADTVAHIVAIAANSIPTGGQSVEAVIERGKILGFMHSILDASRDGEGPIQIVVSGAITDEMKKHTPRIVEAIIGGLIAAIEEGAHQEVNVEFITPAGETKQ